MSTTTCSSSSSSCGIRSRRRENTITEQQQQLLPQPHQEKRMEQHQQQQHEREDVVTSSSSSSSSSTSGRKEHHQAMHPLSSAEYNKVSENNNNSALQQRQHQEEEKEEEQEGPCLVFRQMWTFWIFGIMLPAAIMAWKFTGGKSWSITISATFFTPTFAIIQGAIGILTYRLYYGDAPVPLSPSHGVVCAVSRETKNGAKSKTQANEQHRCVATGGCECNGRMNGTSSSCSSSSFSLSKESRLFLQQQQERAVLHHQKQQSSQQKSPLDSQQQSQPPLRLLVIGDSLAVGVGQKKSCTPLMPETIAKALSKKMGGRVVYWTCHGSTGASAGWLVRELERGQQPCSNSSSREEETEHDEFSEHLHLEQPPREAAASSPVEISKIVPARSSSLSCCSDTDDSSSEDEYSSEFSIRGSSTSALGGSINTPAGARIRRRSRASGDKISNKAAATTTTEESTSTQSSGPSMAVWRDLLKEHRKLFEHPEYLGPYDIAVVLTGPNDLKSSVFPFLLTGEDAEFRRQAVERSGGSYRMELRRLLETLNRKMQWKNFQEFVSAAKESVREKMEETQEFVSAAKESVREKMEETMERIIVTTSSKAPPTTSPTAEPTAGNETDETNPRIDVDEQPQQDENPTKEDHVPLIVLPGMPARALPIFQHVPLRWLAVPMTDMMDMHKRHIAKSHPDEVLFVEAPTEREISSYVEKMALVETSDHGSLQCATSESNDEAVLLALRDVKRRDCRRVEGAMRTYYSQKDLLGQKSTFSAYINNPFKLIRTHLFGFPPALHLKAFSPDGVHPNDMGYDFWGRHIADAIYDQHMAKNKRSSS